MKLLREDTQFEKLKTLKEIAETLNEGNHLKETLHAVLQKLLRLTGLKTAWLFLIDEKGSFDWPLRSVCLRPLLTGTTVYYAKEAATVLNNTGTKSWTGRKISSTAGGLRRP